MTLNIIVLLLISIFIYFFIKNIIIKNVTYQFIHIPKNAGTAICKSASLQGLDICCSKKDWSCHQGAHDKIDYFLKERPYNTIYITSIRNPYDRFISAFSHYKYKSKRYANEVKKRKFDITKFVDVNDFIQKIISKNKNALKLFHDILFDTQTEYICSKYTNKIHQNVKYMLRQENLSEDINYLCKKTGVCIKLIKNNFDSNINTYPSIKLNKTSIEFINKHYKRDFMLLPYEMKSE